MKKRTRKRDNSEETMEGPTNLTDALNYDLEAEIYNRFSQIINEYGTDLLLRIYTTKGDDKRSLGFIDEIIGEEINLFLRNPEIFLKDKFGSGTFRIQVGNNTNKKFITNLTIAISTLKNDNTRKTNDVIEELSRAKREARSELVEILNLSKPQDQSPLDFVKFFEIMMSQQDKIREREDKQRQKELEFLKETTRQSSHLSEQFKPMFDFMGDVGKVFSGVMKVVDHSVRLAQEMNPKKNETSVKDAIVDVAKTFITNPEVLSKLAMPNIATPIPRESSLGQPDPFGQVTPKPPEKTIPKEGNETQANEFNLDLAFPIILSKYIKRGIRKEDAQFCADSILADLDDLLEEKLISEDQLQETYNLLISEHLFKHIEGIFPEIKDHKNWITEFQKHIYRAINPPEEKEKTEESEITNITPTQ